MIIKMKNYAFIDGQNLYIEVTKLCWEFDYFRFRKFLFDKYKAEKALYFIGYRSENRRIYEYLSKAGFELVFKKVLLDKNRTPKGNCDADLIVKCFDEIDNFEKGVFVSGDGDFLPLYKSMNRRGKLYSIGIPSVKSRSSLLNPMRNFFFYIDNLKMRVRREGTNP